MENIINKYNSFLESIGYLFKEEFVKNLLDKINKEENEKKIERLFNFHKSLEDIELFNLLVRTKIKLFSSKNENTKLVSNSLFKELSLKNIFNNQNNQVKMVLWSYLKQFYIFIENNGQKREERLNKLEIKMSTDEIKDKIKKNIFDVDMNNTTNGMIDDIVKSFQDVSKGNGNPFDSIMDITNKITQKYEQKIDNGEIEIDKLLGSLTKNMPGIGNIVGNKTKPKEKVIIDENFSTSKVELGDKDKTEKGGFNMSKMMGMMNTLNGSNGGPNIGKLMNIMNKVKDVKDKDEAIKLKDEMENIMKNDLGFDMDKFNKSMNINK